MLGHVSGIRNLDLPLSVVSCQILLGEEEKKREGSNPLKAHTTEECEGMKKQEERQNRKTDMIEIERKESD